MKNQLLFVLAVMTLSSTAFAGTHISCKGNTLSLDARYSSDPEFPSEDVFTVRTYVGQKQIGRFSVSQIAILSGSGSINGIAFSTVQGANRIGGSFETILPNSYFGLARPNPWRTRLVLKTTENNYLEPVTCNAKLDPAF